jgi:hypothetical protein
MSLKYIKEYDNFLNENKKTKIIAYHGSGTKFDKFSMKHRYDNNGNVGADLGHWFAFNRKDVIGASASHSKELDKKLNELIVSQRKELNIFKTEIVNQYKDSFLGMLDTLIKNDYKRSSQWEKLKMDLVNGDYDNFLISMEALIHYNWIDMYKNRVDVPVWYEFLKDSRIKDKQNEFDNIYKNLEMSQKVGYIYKVELTLNKVGEEDGEDIGIGDYRANLIYSYKEDDYDALIIRNADTGYYIGDEIVVFKDRNIKILDVEEIHF